MKKLFTLLLALVLVIPVGACTSEEGGGPMADYIYNGTELPALPEWDKETYPYAVIYHYLVGVHHLFFSKTPWEGTGKTKVIDGTSYGKAVSTANTSGVLYVAISTSAEWSLGDSTNLVNNLGSQSGGRECVVWSNHDIVGADGSVLLAASEPVKKQKLFLSVGETTLYNGIGLPPLPEWDREKYPYAIARQRIDDILSYEVWLFVCMDPFVAFSESDTRVSTLRESGVKYNAMQYKMSDDETEWNLSSGEINLGPNSNGTFDMGHVEVFWSNVDIPYLDNPDALYLSASEPVAVDITETTVTATFFCDDLNYEDVVYNLQAWIYPKGSSYQNAVGVFTSERFAGTAHRESHTFTGLMPNTEYEIYAVIVGADGSATDQNATVAFTTKAVGTEPFLLLTANQITGNGFTLFITTQNLEADTPYTAEVLVYEPDSSRVVFEGEVTIEGSSGIDFIHVTGLEPETEYAVSVDIYPDGGEVLLHGDHTVTTTSEVPAVRDLFPLGFASGLSGVPVLEAGDYNTWAQGYIAGCAMRKALRKE